MKALTRSTLLGIPLALVIMVLMPRHGRFLWDFLDAFTLAFSFLYVGHWVEVLLLKIPGIETSGGKIVRVGGWFAGGLWCYVLARWALMTRDSTLQLERDDFEEKDADGQRQEQELMHPARRHHIAEDAARQFLRRGGAELSGPRRDTHQPGRFSRSGRAGE